ncbi:hypothetical protein EYF80_005428 [Liparis tanakae]|uniref:Uncharacterized protein n=1 Tax=Liparis tanakae TaxID=230148 RepID=A0A4Z2J251_9TELE|nr:hypothetical protein EYF80_005428 [Liparis tanakae]
MRRSRFPRLLKCLQFIVDACLHTERGLEPRLLLWESPSQTTGLQSLEPFSLMRTKRATAEASGGALRRGAATGELLFQYWPWPRPVLVEGDESR